MDIKTIFVVCSSILMVVCVIPYLVEVVRGKAKPRVVSWFIWSIITGIGCAAAFVDHQYPTAILLLLSSMGTMLTGILGWKYGDKKIAKLDVSCFVGALIGLVLWRVFDSPALAVMAMIMTDFVGGIPSLVHAWRKPYEETLVSYMLSFFAASFTLLALSDWVFTAAAYPIFLFAIYLTYTVILFFRRRVVKK